MGDEEPNRLSGLGLAVGERFTSADLELMPDDGKRYEVIDGELHVSRQPGWEHQFTCGRLFRFLDEWSQRTGLGAVNLAPGLIFAEDDDVAPDLVWLSHPRLATALRDDGKLHAAPELVVEVLSPGSANERRDRQTKLKLLYMGAVECWSTGSSMAWPGRWWSTAARPARSLWRPSWARPLR